MAVPEAYLAHSVSLAKKIKNGELKADRDFLIEHLKKSYSESVSIRIAQLAIELSQCDDVSKAAWSRKKI